MWPKGGMEKRYEKRSLKSEGMTLELAAKEYTILGYTRGAEAF